MWRQIYEKISKSIDFKQAWALSWKEAQSKAKLVRYNGRLYSNYRVKASAFIQEYTTIGGRKTVKPSLEANRLLVLKTATCFHRQAIDVSFATAELKRAPKLTKMGMSTGPVEVAPDLFKHLPPSETTESQTIICHSWMKGWCPKAFRFANIMPVIKKRNKPADIGSYRLNLYRRQAYLSYDRVPSFIVA